MYQRITLTCDNCREPLHYDNITPQKAEGIFIKKGGEINDNYHLCYLCVRRRDTDYFAIDIGDKDPQILAVLYDIECLKQTRLITSLDFMDSSVPLTERKEKRNLSLRRITKSEYETLGAFGIPVVSVDEIILSNNYRGRVIPDKEDKGIFYTSSSAKKVQRVLDLREPISLLLGGKLPEKAA